MKKNLKIEYLETYLVLYYRVANYKDEIDKVTWEEAQPSGIDYSADKVQTSPEDSMLNKVLRIESRVNEYQELISKANEQMQYIVDSINQVPDGNLLRLLYLRYIKSDSWETIGNEIGFDPVYARGQLHGQAIDLLRIDPRVMIVRKNLQKDTKSYR